MDNRTIIGLLSTIGLALCFQASPALAQITVNTAEGLREALIAAGGRLYYSEDWDVFHDSKAVEIEPGLVCFETPVDFKAVPGDVLTVRDRIRRQTGSLIQYSENIRLEGMKYRFMHGLGVVSQFTRNISIVDCVFTPSEDSGRVIASSADFAHFSGCAGLVEVRGCRFCGAHDDPINVHGTNLRAVRKVSDRTVVVRFCHGQTYGLKAFRPGDKVCFERAETLDRNLPDGLRLGSDCVENLTWTPEVIISGNEFSRTSTRGILLTTPRKAVIENNVFRHVGMNGILIAGDAADWFESGPVCDVTIRGNRFEDCTFNGGPDNAYIAIHPSNTVVDKAIPVHRNIRIEGNTFVLRDGCPALSAKSVCGLQEEISALLKDFPGEAGVAVAVGKDRINRQKSASD